MSSSPIFRLFSVFCLSLFLFACGPRGTEEIIEDRIEEETGEDAEVDMEDGAMYIETEEGTVDVGAVSLPADWPTDVSVYEGATITQVMSVNPATGDAGRAVIFTTTDTAADVVAFYKSQLPLDGWTMEASMEAGTTTILSGAKDERKVSLMIVWNGEMTSVTMGLQE